MADDIQTNEIVKNRWIIHVASGLFLAMKSNGSVTLEIPNPKDRLQQWKFTGEIEPRGTIQNVATNLYLYPDTNSTNKPEPGQLMKGLKDKPYGRWDNWWSWILFESPSYHQTLNIHEFNWLWVTAATNAEKGSSLTIESLDNKARQLFATPEVPTGI